MSQYREVFTHSPILLAVNSFDYTWLKSACENLSKAIERNGEDRVVIIISTVLPGTVRKHILPLLCDKVKLCYNPFFIAMGTTIRDFYHLSQGGRGKPATVQTHASLTYDDENLYVAAVCYDSKTMEFETPYHLRKKGVDFYNSIELFLDTNADAKSYYQIVLDYTQRLWSAYYQAEGQADKSWVSQARA